MVVQLARGRGQAELVRICDRDSCNRDASGKALREAQRLQKVRLRLHSDVHAGRSDSECGRYFGSSTCSLCAVLPCFGFGPPRSAPKPEFCNAPEPHWINQIYAPAADTVYQIHRWCRRLKVMPRRYLESVTIDFHPNQSTL